MPSYETTRLFNTILNLYYNEELTQVKNCQASGTFHCQGQPPAPAGARAGLRQHHNPHSVSTTV